MGISSKFSDQAIWWPLLAGVVLSIITVIGSAYLLNGILKLYGFIGISGKYISGPSVVFWVASIVSILPFVAVICVPPGMRWREHVVLVGVLIALSAAVGYSAISAFVETAGTTGYLVDMISIIAFSFLFTWLGSRFKAT
jgi:hypothetical protein